MQNHIDVSAHRDPPAHILRALRSIDPTVDLHYMGEGQWTLGSVRENSPTRLQTACKLIAHEWRKPNPEWGQLRLGKMMLAGFYAIADYHLLGTPTMAIVYDFQARDWRWRNCPEETFEQHFDVTDGGPEERAMHEKFRDYAETEARAAYRYAVKGRRVYAAN